MEICKTRGIIARRRDFGESNCMLTVLTDDMGVISASAYGVRSKKSKMKAGTQVLCCAEFVLSKKSGDIYRVDSLEVVDSFYPICEDITKLALANYLCELSCEAAMDGDGNILSLLLNTLYVLAYKDTNPLLAKAVFELKLMQYSGYEPQMHSCVRCEGADNLSAFNMSGGVVCTKCRENNDISISTGAYSAVRYILDSEEKKIFSFSVSDDVKKEISHLAEGYLLQKSERTYKSLDYFRKII